MSSTQTETVNEIRLTTKELSEELSRRLGVDTITVDPHQEFVLTVGDQQYSFTGPATILINQD
ncbi:BC1881 family protein [Paenibacillus barcinonensis]|uniref:BC1881 family protein n=1 Tax=Paenibacillus barcinonensis TaxID=198119 RepID=UPI001C125B18|nr:BC1881 family protein [Paenibacillus barcinonensis]MBU5356131.1 BC1881 family protein [Paenibacillus barcinonensis]